MCFVDQFPHNALCHVGAAQDTRRRLFDNHFCLNWSCNGIRWSMVLDELWWCSGKTYEYCYEHNFLDVHRILSVTDNDVHICCLCFTHANLANARCRILRWIHELRSVRHSGWPKGRSWRYSAEGIESAYSLLQEQAPYSCRWRIIMMQANTRYALTLSGVWSYNKNSSKRYKTLEA